MENIIWMKQQKPSNQMQLGMMPQQQGMQATGGIMSPGGMMGGMAGGTVPSNSRQLYELAEQPASSPQTPIAACSSSSSAPTRDAELSSYSESSSLYDECLQVHPCPRPDSPYAIRFCCHLTWKPKQRTPLITRSIPPSTLHAPSPPSPMPSI